MMHTLAVTPKLVTRAEAAEIVRMSQSMLARLTYVLGEERGPGSEIPAVRIGNRVLYDLRQVEGWVDRKFAPPAGDDL